MALWEHVWKQVGRRPENATDIIRSCLLPEHVPHASCPLPQIIPFCQLAVSADVLISRLRDDAPEEHREPDLLGDRDLLSDYDAVLMVLVLSI